MASLVTEAAGHQMLVLLPDNPILLCSADDDCTHAFSEAKVKDVIDAILPLSHAFYILINERLNIPPYKAGILAL